MSIQGPGILFRLRAGGNCRGMTVVRAVANATYLTNAGVLKTAAANLLRLHWADTNGDGVYETPTYQIEPTATNIVLWSRDLTNAAWAKINTTAAKTQVGVDGAANSASLLTATAGNGTVSQQVVSGSSARSFTAFVKRVIGTGTINMTMDNGATWTVITPTTQYTRIRIPTQTLANPIVGFRIVTNGDAIAVDYMQLESTNYDTTPVLTTTVAVTRNADQCSATFGVRPVAMTTYLRYVATTAVPASEIVQLLTGGGSVRCYLSVDSTGKARYVHDAGAGLVASAVGSTPTAGQIVEVRGVLNSDGSVIVGQSLGGAAESVSSLSSANPLAPIWDTPTIWLGSNVGGSGCPVGLMNVVVARGVRDLNACRGLV